MKKYKIITYVIIFVLLVSCQQNKNIPVHRLQ